ncbi:enoyl-CoA hydratase/isomerase family protein [Frankia sp. Cr2]|uniref:enoyl-CoA hydratase/isomerase family protein n=1 Tax=Frankia sp. Cr2 TaxID=3073932 RepID=UPI002AD400C0|nr:enoyl-CoA hydratase/isomerase family protein [Frankia sp. Cr2]
MTVLSAGRDVAVTVTVTVGNDHVATVELCRPPNNTLDVALVTAVADALESLDADETCRAVVLCAQGRHFCAGAQLGASAPGGGPIPMGYSNPLYDQARRLFATAVPIVAAVQGGAIGGGLGLALVADFRMTCTEARFSANFAKLGFHPGFGLSVTLPALVGQQQAADLLYTGRRVGGEEAVRLGLCDRLVDAADLRAAAHGWAAEIATSAPLAVRAVRRTLRGDLAARAAAAMQREHQAQKALRGTGDYTEGVAAYAERRPPHFTGH